MKYNNFGATGLKVSQIGFGSAAISGEGGGYGFGAINEQEAISLLRSAKELGINLIDTAPIYGFTLAEKRIGKAFNKNEKDDLILVSKSGVTWHDNKRVDMTNDPKVAEQMLHQSLKDLQTDVIDIYMVHWPDEKFDIRRVMEVYLKAQEQGKIRFIGLCNTHLEDYKKASEVANILVLQSEFNVFNQKAKKEIFPLVKKENLAFMSWGTLDKGIITGRLTEKRMYQDDYDCRKTAPWWNKDEVLAKVKKITKHRSFIEDKGYTLLEFALGHNLTEPEVSQVLCGARNINQLESLVKAIEHLPDIKLINEMTQRLNE